MAYLISVVIGAEFWIGVVFGVVLGGPIKNVISHAWGWVTKKIGM